MNNSKANISPTAFVLPTVSKKCTNTVMNETVKNYKHYDIIPPRSQWHKIGWEEESLLEIEDSCTSIHEVLI